MFMVLSSWQSHCESSPGSFDECRTAVTCSTDVVRPLQSTVAEVVVRATDNALRRSVHALTTST